ncbi:MAG: L,D-transpeptidase family protein [Desulfobacterota bacterium]|jgi:L,D-transpeptidase ErfK/SrfK|nr:L,D-transpeptidase family protein [Thermodesulfobacteriota bacterium]
MKQPSSFFRKHFLRLMLIGGALAGAWAEAEARVEKTRPPLQGGEGLYNARSRDSLYAIAGRLGQRWEYLARLNELQPPFALSIGQKLQINNRHIVPSAALTDGLLLNLPGHMIYLYNNGTLIRRFPVAIGRPDWPTPEGNFTLVGKQKNPVWTVPKSIQEELRKEGRVVLDKVPPGPDNPLGKYWLPLSTPGYGIHSTIWPESIGHSTSHGCIRMLPEDIAGLFPLVQSGTPVAIVYEPIKLTAADDGRVFLEVHPNVYQKRLVYPERLQTLVRRFGLAEQVDWNKAAAVLAEQAGVAEDISRGEAQNGKRAAK